MSLIRNFKTANDQANTIGVSWTMPLDFNNSTDEIIVTRTSSHYPVELYNTLFPNKATDSRPVEIFRGKTIVGTNTGTISVAGEVLTDSAASFPVSPKLTGRLVRDSLSQVFKILDNTTTTLTLSGTPQNGKYVILPDFPLTLRLQQNFEFNIQTTAGAGFVKNLVSLINGSYQVQTFVPDELANMIFKDSLNNRFIIKSNTADTVYFFETASTPSLGISMAVLDNFKNSSTALYIDTFSNDTEALARTGTGLSDNTFYYYTGFTLAQSANVAQAQFGSIDSGVSTQDSALSTKDRQFGSLIYNNFWPSLDRELDTSEDLQDLMEVFGFDFNYLHALITTYNLQDAESVFVNAVLPLSEQTGLPSIGFAIGADTLRRVARDMIPCWHLKGSKEGIALFIRKITTWDITNGTADFNSAVVDFLPNVSALRFFDSVLGSANTRLTQTSPAMVPGGRFAKSLPGIVIPGFFTFREFVINVPNVALFVGSTTSVSVSNNTTTISDGSANYGLTNSLVGNFILPNQEEINDIFEIIGNTATTITARGIFNNKNPGGSYAVLSPLNTNRFIILNKLMPVYIPYGTRAGYTFT